jgi:LPS-assembly lipoprotein
MSLAEERLRLGRGADRKGWRRSFSAVSLAMLCALGLSACGDGSTGFRPLYATSAMGGAGAEEKLAAVDVAPIPGRVGQRIRNELIFQTTGGGSPKPPLYRLDIAIRESVTSTMVTVSGNAGGQIYNIEASFSLIRLSDKQVVAQGKSYGRAAYDRMSSIFANVEARQDAENRAARTVAEELRTRLLALLSTTA